MMTTRKQRRSYCLIFDDGNAVLGGGEGDDSCDHHVY